MSDLLDIDAPGREVTTDPKRLEQLFAALSARVNTEISTYWARNNLLLVLNAGLLAVGFDQTAAHPARVILALFGIITSLLLFFTAIRGRAWLRFWENRLVKLEALLPQPLMYPDYWLMNVKEAVKRGRPKPVTSIILPIPLIVICAWLFLLWEWFGE